MSFLYPRTISIMRPNPQTGVGLQPYSGQTPSAESLVVAGIPASIQFKKAAETNPAGLPTDAKMANYCVFSRQLGLGVVNKHDVVVDDLGLRYEVVAPYWDSLGANLFCKQLEV